MQDNKSGLFTRSCARAKHIVIPESAILSDSEDDIRLDARRVRLVSYGASKSPAASTNFQRVQMSQDVPVTMNENVSAPTSAGKSGPPRTSAVLQPFSTHARFKLGTKANYITHCPHTTTRTLMMTCLSTHPQMKGICDGPLPDPWDNLKLLGPRWRM